MLYLFVLFCLWALTLVNAHPGHGHGKVHRFYHARRDLTDGQAKKPNDITAIGVQSATLATSAPSNSGVGRLL